MATPAKKIEVTVRLCPEWLATIDAIAEVYTNERCDESNPEPFTREDILQQCLLRGLVLEEVENLGSDTTNPHAPREDAPLDPVSHEDADAYTELMLALFEGAKELRRKALRAHDNAERVTSQDEWEQSRTEFNRASNADGYADQLLAEHKRMVQRRWRAEQTPGHQALLKKWRDKDDQERPERELRGAREGAEYAQRQLREVEAKVRGKAKVASKPHTNGATP